MRPAERRTRATHVKRRVSDDPSPRRATGHRIGLRPLSRRPPHQDLRDRCMSGAAARSRCPPVGTGSAHQRARRRPPVGTGPSPGPVRVWGAGPRRRPDLHHLGQPLRPRRRRHPPLGEEEQGRTVLHPDLRFLGQPDRSSLRTLAAVHPGQLPPSQPPRADQRPCTATCAGAMPAPATPTYSPRNAGNAPASAARRASDGEDVPSLLRPDHRTGRRGHSRRPVAIHPIKRVEPGGKGPRRRVRDRPPHPTDLRPQRSRSPRSWPGTPRCRD